jgi:hypothetical protein
MGITPFAFSVHHFISTVGADAGFAAIIGLAILVLLFFSQARETATLREQAADSAEHLQELEVRLAQLSRAPTGSGTGTIPPVPPPAGIARTAAAPAPAGVARTAPAPAPAAAAARTGAGAPVSARPSRSSSAPAGVPAAPAGVGAPALSAATKLIPTAEPDSLAARGANGVAGQPSGAVISPSGPPPATAAGTANGSSSPRGATTVPPPARPAARPAAARPPAPPRRPGAAPPGRSGQGGGSSRTSRVFIGLATLLGVVAVVIVLLVVTSGGSSNRTPSTPTQTSNAQAGSQRSTKVTGPIKPASVTVAVLNGTSTANLAQSVATQLQKAGFKHGTIGNASDQTQTATVVGYMPGQRNAALVVARSLKLGSASVQPVDQSNKTVACPASSSACTAQVVVAVGSDLASNP